MNARKLSIPASRSNVTTHGRSRLPSPPAHCSKSEGEGLLTGGSGSSSVESPSAMEVAIRSLRDEAKAGRVEVVIDPAAQGISAFESVGGRVVLPVQEAQLAALQVAGVQLNRADPDVIPQRLHLRAAAKLNQLAPLAFGVGCGGMLAVCEPDQQVAVIGARREPAPRTGQRLHVIGVAAVVGRDVPYGVTDPVIDPVGREPALLSEIALIEGVDRDFDLNP